MFIKFSGSNVNGVVPNGKTYFQAVGLNNQSREPQVMVISECLCIKIFSCGHYMTPLSSIPRNVSDIFQIYFLFVEEGLMQIQTIDNIQ